MVTSPMARIRNGNASHASVSRMMSLIEPAAVVAGHQAHRHADGDGEQDREHARLHGDARPHTTREKPSRPRSSVPNGWAHDGALRS